MSALREALLNLPDTVFADLLESDDEYLLIVDLPGVTSETASIATDDGRLQIEARREKTYPEGFHFVQEERDAFLDADLPLPSEATGAEASATIERGVLELRLPKRTTTEETSIPIEDA